MSAINKHLVLEILDQASDLEILMADIYTIFEESFSEDRNFWHQLAHEEKNHAALIRSIKSSHTMSTQFVSNLPDNLLEENIKTKEWATSLFIKFSQNKPDRKTAFNAAIEIEKTAEEVHYQSIMTKKGDSWFIKVFQELNEYDRDHLKRIIKYVKDNKII
jgi:hypothetical protein